jgi:predicted adenine nucleotide alpha hydrolase (AANH) superfamily ATPase
MPKTTSPLLHVCCAPCSGPIIEKMLADGFTPTIFFYNPNIHPREEYEKRKASVTAFVLKKGLRLIDCDYDPDRWMARVKGLEAEPERGKRCSVCFDIRLERSALYASEHEFTHFATTNGIARWKDIEQVNQSGLKAASHYPGLTFMAINWRKDGASARISAIAKQEKFYQQAYCGCRFSLRKVNENRKVKGLSLISET